MRAVEKTTRPIAFARISVGIRPFWGSAAEASGAIRCQLVTKSQNINHILQKALIVVAALAHSLSMLDGKKLKTDGDSGELVMVVGGNLFDCDSAKMMVFVCVRMCVCVCVCLSDARTIPAQRERLLICCHEPGMGLRLSAKFSKYSSDGVLETLPSLPYQSAMTVA